MKRFLFPVLAFALVASLLAPISASASDLSIMAAYWDTDQLGEAAGAGLRNSWDIGSTGKLDLTVFYLEELDETTEIDSFSSLADAFTGQGVEVLPVDLGVRFGPGGFYYGAGISYYFLEGPDGIDLEDEVGWYAVIGYEFGGDSRGGGIRFFVEGQYRDIEGTAGSEFPEIRDEIILDISGAFVTLGVTF